MNIRNKKNIGILLAAIMVISIFAMVVPAISQSSDDGVITPQWHYNWPERNITVVTPTNLSCVHDTINLSWVNDTGAPVKLTGKVYIGISDACDDCLDADDYKMCSGGCSFYEMDLTKSPWKDWVTQCKDFCVLVWNGSDIPTYAHSVNGSIFRYDAVGPCIDNCKALDGSLDASGNKWFNGTVPIGLNVTACDECCGIHNVTANISAVKTSGGVVDFNKQGTGDDICKGEDEACPGDYYNYTIGVAIEETNIVDITVIARDNSTGKAGSNTAECNITFGVDKTAPEKPNGPDPCCEKKPGKIVVYWKAVADKGPAIPSGVKEYNVYAQDENGTAGYGHEKTVSADPSGTYVCGGKNYQYKHEFKSMDDHIGHYYTFKINATDYALNRGELSNATGAQKLTQGPPADIYLEVPATLEGCGDKYYNVITATVKDEPGSSLGGIEVCFNTTDGQVCPTQKKTSQTCPYNASVDYTAPKVVLESYNVTVCAWVCINDSIVNCSNILITPKQAVNATITPDKTMIATDGATSNITVQLVDILGNPVAGSGNMNVEVTTTAGTFASTGTDTVTGKIAAGKFTTTLVSGDTPTLATVSANVGSLYFPTTTVQFCGYGTYDIKLYEGWNLISVPLVPVDEDAGDVFLPIINELDAAWAYDGCDDEWTSGWYPAPPSPMWTGDLEEVQVERGYWLEMKEQATLTIEGFVMEPGGEKPPPTYDVCKGWNLVGYYAIPPDKVMTAKKYFTEVTVSYKVLGFDGASQGWTTIDKGDNLYSGKGYWMKAEKDGEITPQEWV